MAYNPDRYNNDPEYRERRKQLSKAYYDRVKDTPEFKAKHLARVKAWREANPEKRRAYATKYMKQYYTTVLKPRRQEAGAHRTQEDIERIRKYNNDYYHNVRKHKRQRTKCVNLLIIDPIKCAARIVVSS